MKSVRKRLTEHEKIEILKAHDKYGSNWTLIGRELSINPNSIRSFFNSFTKHGTLSPRMGRPKTISQEIKDGVIGAVEFYPESKLRDIKSLFDISTASIRSILNEDQIKFHPKIPVPSLTEKHKIERVRFANKFAHLSYRDMPVIIFSDESSVQVNLDSGGIWRRRGEYPNGSFCEKNAYPVKVMVWGAIGPEGFRTTLIRIDGAINAKTYIKMLHDNNIHAQIYEYFGDDFIFQQDNARPHTAQETKEYLDAVFPNRLDWPAKSPDLSPIEQIWDYLKSKIAGDNITNSNELFDRIQLEWNMIPNAVIHNIYSSFLARCITCVRINGDNLNGHWREVRKVHDSYRTSI